MQRNQPAWEYVMPGRESVEDLYPEEVAKGVAEGTILLVDVREPNETDIERYPEAVYMPDVRVRPFGAARSGGQARRFCVPHREIAR
jgi:rhodanese-related sulfurtransferase